MILWASKNSKKWRIYRRRNHSHSQLDHVEKPNLPFSFTREIYFFLIGFSYNDAATLEKILWCCQHYSMVFRLTSRGSPSDKTFKIVLSKYIHRKNTVIRINFFFTERHELWYSVFWIGYKFLDLTGLSYHHVLVLWWGIKNGQMTPKNLKESQRI